jgi:hypothetical protein
LSPVGASIWNFMRASIMPESGTASVSATACDEVRTMSETSHLRVALPWLRDALVEAHASRSLPPLRSLAWLAGRRQRVLRSTGRGDAGCSAPRVQASLNPRRMAGGSDARRARRN